MGAETFDNNDPYSQVYAAILRFIRDEPGLVDRIKERNIVEYNTRNRDPTPGSDNANTTPQLRITPSATNDRLVMSSKSTEIIQQFLFELRCGDLRVHEVLFPVKWHLMKAVAKMKNGETPMGLDFVENIDVVATADINQNADGTNIKQWISFFTIQVVMTFTTATDLLK